MCILCEIKENIALYVEDGDVKGLIGLGCQIDLITSVVLKVMDATTLEDLEDVQVVANLCMSDEQDVTFSRLAVIKHLMENEESGANESIEIVFEEDSRTIKENASLTDAEEELKRFTGKFN